MCKHGVRRVTAILSGVLFMSRVFVLGYDKQPLIPCRSARARILLNSGKTVVYQLQPCTIILTYSSGKETQVTELKIDPSSRQTGLAIVLHGAIGNKVIWCATLAHRGHVVSQALTKRRSIRRSRRSRKLRYRAARFNNRRRKQGWLAPSLRSRVDNVYTWTKRLQRLAPITDLAIEDVKFNMQKILNPEISGVQYQQGTLAGYEVREYLLEKWQRTCIYCEAKNLPLQIEHLIPRSHGGSNRPSNLGLACRACNAKKGSQKLQDFLAHYQVRLKSILQHTKVPLKDAAAVNSTRLAIIAKLQNCNLPILQASGGQTKFNRTSQGYPKEHWVDAACIGETGEKVFLSKNLRPLIITAMGKGSRQMCRVDKHGFPRTSAKAVKQVHGFRTGDLVLALVTKDKKLGKYQGRVAVRTSGNFNIKTRTTTIEGISFRYCKLLQPGDGYNYNLGDGVSSSC